MSREDHLTGSSSSRSSRSQRARTPTPPPTPPLDPRDPDLAPINDEEGYAPPPEEMPEEHVPETPPQPHLRLPETPPQPAIDNRVPDWLNDVPTTPGPVPSNASPPGRIRAPRTEDKTTEGPNEGANRVIAQRRAQPWYRHENMNALKRNFWWALLISLLIALGALKMAESDAGRHP